MHVHGLGVLGWNEGHLISCFLPLLPVPHSLKLDDKFLADQDLVLTFTSCSVLGRKPCSTEILSEQRNEMRK